MCGGGGGGGVGVCDTCVKMRINAILIPGITQATDLDVSSIVLIWVSAIHDKKLRLCVIPCIHIATHQRLAQRGRSDPLHLGEIVDNWQEMRP